MLVTRFSLPDPGFWLPDSGYQVLGTRFLIFACSSENPVWSCGGGYQILATDPGCQILVTRFWLPDAEPGYQNLANYQTLASTSKLPDRGHQIMTTRCWLPDAACPIVATRSWQLCFAPNPVRVLELGSYSFICFYMYFGIFM